MIVRLGTRAVSSELWVGVKVGVKVMVSVDQSKGPSQDQGRGYGKGCVQWGSGSGLIIGRLLLRQRCKLHHVQLPHLRQG